MIVAAGAWWISRDSTTANATSLPFGQRDWLIIAALENGSGEKVFDGSVEYLLERELTESRLVKVISRERIGDGLRLMKRAPDTRIDRAVAREIALRDGAIRAIAAPHIERLGSRYVVGIDLIDVPTGDRVAAFSEKARTHDEIADALSRSARKLRMALGEERLPAASNQKLERVTTPSLRALQLFTQADRVIAWNDDEAAEKLLREAVTEDPHFASAYIYLAFAIRNQQRPSEEYLPYADRAVQLSSSATDRERDFILASHASMKGNLEEALLRYKALLDRHPDHFWATINVGNLLKFQLGRAREAAPYRIRLAQLRPNEFIANFAAGESLEVLGSTEEAKRYFARSVELISPADQMKSRELVTWARLHRLHTAWLDGDMSTVNSELEKWTALSKRMTGPHADLLIDGLAQAEVAVGRFDRAEALIPAMADPALRKHLAAHIAFWRGDRRSANRRFQEFLDTGAPGTGSVYLNVLRATQCGLVQHAERLMAGLPEPQPAIRDILRGAVLLQKGRPVAAVADLDRGIRQTRSIWYRTVAFQLAAADALAQALEQNGDPSRAIVILEEASQHRSKTLAFGKPEWVELRRHLARLYRATGRGADAAGVEAEIEKLTLPTTGISSS